MDPLKSDREPVTAAEAVDSFNAKMAARRQAEADRRAALSPEARAAEDERIAQERQQAAEARAHAERDSKRRDLAGMGIPERLIPRLLDGALDRDAPAFAALRNAANTGKRLVVLSGQPGCGKTTAACMALATSGYGLFLSAWARTRASVYSEEVDAWADASMLVIDDVGEEYQDAKGFTLAVLDQLITERYDSNRITLITTNLAAARFRERLGERVADRIREVGVYVELSGDSLRRSAKAPAPAAPKDSA